MKKRWSEISGTPVVTDEKMRPLGRVNAAFIHPENGTLIAFLVGFSHVLTPIDIEKWCADHILISSDEVLVGTFDILRLSQFGLRRTFFMGKKVYSKNGKKYGRVRDFTIDTKTSSLLDFEVSKGFFFIKWGKRIFSYSDISEITDNSVTVNVEPEQKAKVKMQAVPVA